MKLNLSSEEISFLNKELGVTIESLNNLTIGDWKAIREKCLDIDVEESIKQEENGEEYSRRGMIADSIIDKRFSELYL